MFESFRDRDLKDTGSCDELGAGAPVVPSKGDHSGELRKEGAKHTQREGLYDLSIRSRGGGGQTDYCVKHVSIDVNEDKTH